MKNYRFSRLLAVILAVCVICVSMGVMPVFAAEPEIVLEDYTAFDQTTLEGEVKIRVGIKGLSEKASILQVGLEFDGNMKYKGITFLKGEDNVPICYRNYPNSALANNDKNMIPSIISSTPLEYAVDENGISYLFILTFEKDKDVSVGDSAVSAWVDKDATFYMKDLSEKKLISSGEAINGVKASSVAKSSKTASVKLDMSGFPTFCWGANSNASYAGSDVFVKLTSEDTQGYTVYTELNCAKISMGGHRENTSAPIFTVTNTVLDDSYTVEISGTGFVTKVYENVSFDETLVVTSKDFVAGDVNGDGVVNVDDKNIVQSAIDSNSTDEILGKADFNRDGVIDDKDMTVFAGISEDDSSDDKDDEDDKDNNNSGGGGGSSGGGGGSSGGGGGGGGGGSSKEDKTDANDKQEDDKKPEVEDEKVVPSNKSFTDLGGYSWAEESIYKLKELGVISGTSETTYAPAQNIRRGDFILILTRMLGIEEEFEDNFSDVPKDSYYYKAIGSAKAVGIATGDGVSFMPNNAISRQDLITLAYRAFFNAGYIAQGDLSVLDGFNDKNMISDYAINAMASMVEAGIIKGSDGNVNPLGNATRAEVAVMCARLLELVK